MEGNDCYKLTTIRNYIAMTGAAPIRVAVDLGCNVADVTMLIRFYFPESRVFGFEPVEEYYQLASRRMAQDPFVKVLHSAVCGLHQFEDDLGERPRTTPSQMTIMKAREGSGPGWRGGSMLVAEEQKRPSIERYAPQSDLVRTLSLDDVLSLTTMLTGREEIDYVKMDCEGCECDALGCASLETLRRIRFISGEYHDITRFHRVMAAKLYQTHYVNLVGEGWGSFFCERIGEPNTILSPSREGMLLVRPWMCDRPIDWHPFREEFVLPHERVAHGMAQNP